MRAYRGVSDHGSSFNRFDVESNLPDFETRDYKEDFRETRISEQELTSLENQREKSLSFLLNEREDIKALKVKLEKIRKEICQSYLSSKTETFKEYEDKLERLRLQMAVLEDQEFRINCEISRAQGLLDHEKVYESFRVAFRNLKSNCKNRKSFNLDGILSRDSQSIRSPPRSEQFEENELLMNSSPTRKKTFVISDESYRKAVRLDEERLVQSSQTDDDRIKAFDEERKPERREPLRREIRPKMESERPPNQHREFNPFLTGFDHSRSGLKNGSQKQHISDFRKNFFPDKIPDLYGASRVFRHASKKRRIQSRERGSNRSINLTSSPYKQLIGNEKKVQGNSPALPELDQSTERLSKKNRESTWAYKKVYFGSSRVAPQPFLIFPESSLYPIPKDCEKLIKAEDRDFDCDSTESTIENAKRAIKRRLKESVQSLPGRTNINRYFHT